MNSLLFGIALSALLSATSLAIVLLRVSPLTAPLQAIPALFISLFLTVASCCTLVFLYAWKQIPHLGWDTGKQITIAMRQGIFVGAATILALLFHINQLLTWWIAILIYLVFLLVEMALIQE